MIVNGKNNGCFIESNKPINVNNVLNINRKQKTECVSFFFIIHGTVIFGIPNKVKNIMIEKIDIRKDACP